MVIPDILRAALLLLLSSSVPNAVAFMEATQFSLPNVVSFPNLTPTFKDELPVTTFSCNHVGIVSRSSSTSLNMANALVMAKSAATAVIRTPLVHQMVFVLVAMSLYLSKRIGRILWPGTKSDDESGALVPPGSFGCPFLGTDIYSGTKQYGPFAGLGRLAKKNKNVSLWKAYIFGMPFISVSGIKNVKDMLKHEFDPKGLNTYMFGKTNFGPIFGEEALLYEPDPNLHRELRSYVNEAMTTSAITAAFPTLQAAANDQIDRVLRAKEIEMENVFNDFTLDIAWKQILGLDLKDEEEILEFHKQTKIWTESAMDMWLIIPIKIPFLMTLTRGGRSRTYLVKKVEEKLKQLDENGPDGSTLSKLYFARGEDGKSKLTRTQVIHNALILIFAGSETSASTLTVATLCLSLHPDVWEMMKEEQTKLQSEFGETLNPEILDARNAPYLDAFIKETMRLRPVEAGEMRQLGGTVEVEGKQLPRGWFAIFNVKQTHLNDPVTYLEDESHMDIRAGFKPERWLDEATKPSEYMPWGEGRRRCVGERLALAEMKIFLSLLARRIPDFEPINKIGPKDAPLWKTNTLMARPLDGMAIRIQPAH
mmetsp:Transcript_18986/g.28318  ORF Transcript_18986/g.28318 Transcript_18986/m.28318 type:complete len:594 (-) Transcript_18986:113-1894(-)